MRIIAVFAKWLFVLSLPFFLVTASIAWVFNSTWLYNYGFARNNVSQTTGLDKAELDKVAQGLVSYLNSRDEYINLIVTKNGVTFPLFNQREVSHMKDVKTLFWLNYKVLAGALAYALAYALVSWRKARRDLGQGLMWGGGLTLALVIGVALTTLLDFDQLFTQFHLLSFANDLWQLDPTKDYLIMLVPRNFWYGVFLICALSTAVGAVLAVGGGYLMSRKASQHAETAV